MVSENCPACLEHGLIEGYAYAQGHNDRDRLALGRIARARSVADVRADLDADLTPPAAVDHPKSYWSGFAHGVGRFLSEQGKLGANAPVDI